MVQEVTRSAYPFHHPEGRFENRYYLGTVDGAPAMYAHTQYLPDTDVIQIHIAPVAMSRRTLRELRADFADLKAQFAVAGLTRIVGAMEVDSPGVEKWRQIVRLFGFHVGKVVTVQGQNYYFIEQETVT